MNSLKSLLFLLILVTALTVIGACKKSKQGLQNEKSSELVLGTNAGYPPYESVNANGDVEGFDIDVANAIAKKLNRKLVVKDMSFDALILALKQDKFDIIMSGISITAAREKE